MDGRKISVSYCFSEQRLVRNEREASQLQEEGYTVEMWGHPNGAYFAFIGNHQEHEKTVGRIFAENGFSFTLDREGNSKIRIKGRLYTLPSVDGHIEGFTHEIAGLQGEPDARTVARAIGHSHKSFVHDKQKSVQADIAITIAPRGSKYSINTIVDGVKEFKRQVTEGETKATPLIYLHVDETRREITLWGIK